VPYAFYPKEVRAWLMYNVVVIPSSIVHDHITLSAPVLGRSPKLSNVDQSWPPSRKHEFYSSGENYPAAAGFE